MEKYIRQPSSVKSSPDNSKIGRLAKALLADRQRPERADTSLFDACFLCGRSYTYRGPNGDDSGRFCSPRCREAYDRGQRASTFNARSTFQMRMGRDGFYITCGGCEREFESKGLRYCGSDCERKARERAETKATLAEVGMEPVTTKRRCQRPGCSRSIPNWRKGRRTPSSAKYCDLHSAARRERPMAKKKTPGKRSTEYFETGSKKGRGMEQRSLDLIEAMHAAAKAAQPITGRGIGYKLFTDGLIPSMAKNEMQRVYRLLKEARERGIIPWDWIVDETRELERVATWSNPAEYARCVARSYRRDFWDQQLAAS